MQQQSALMFHLYFVSCQLVMTYDITTQKAIKKIHISSVASCHARYYDVIFQKKQQVVQRFVFAVKYFFGIKKPTLFFFSFSILEKNSFFFSNKCPDLCWHSLKLHKMKKTQSQFLYSQNMAFLKQSDVWLIGPSYEYQRDQLTKQKLIFSKK